LLEAMKLVQAQGHKNPGLNMSATELSITDRPRSSIRSWMTIH
jgi:hypothetical protein